MSVGRGAGVGDSRSGRGRGGEGRGLRHQVIFFLACMHVSAVGALCAAHACKGMGAGGAQERKEEGVGRSRRTNQGAQTKG